MPDFLHCRSNANNTFARRPYKLSSVHRLRLTHGEQPAVPKLIRENTDQFFAKATGNVNSTTNSKRNSLIRPIFSRDSRKIQPQQSSRLSNHHDEQQRISTSRSRFDGKMTPMAVLPPIERLKSEKSVRSIRNEHFLPALESISTPSIYFQSSLLETSIDENPTNRTELINTPIAETPDPTQRSAKKPTKTTTRRKQREQFFDAYERALAIARARRSFYDPDRLLGPSPTRNVLYSYYDHTPACLFTHGSACGHYGQQSIDYDRRSLSELARRRIYDEIVVDIRR